MAQREYRIQTMNRGELDIAVQWAADEGWNPGLHDAGSYFAVDPTGFLMGYLGDEPIASISVVKYADSFGFLGFYIVKPAYRGQGYGLKIWQAGLQYLAGCNIALDGVVAQQENYKKSGFKLAYRNVRYQGQGQGQGGAEGDVHPDIVPLSSLPFDVVDGYDRPFFPAQRTAFLQHWITQPGSHALALMKHGQLAGYGVIRPCRSGYKIGPLYANNRTLAEDLFCALKAKVPANEPVYLDVPEVNAAAVGLAESHGMKVVFETARMYTGAEPELPMQRLFGVTSFEVG